MKRGKDTTQSMDQPDEVYKIDCDNCDACYVRETERNMGDRIADNVRHSKKPTKQNYLIHDPITNYGHSFNFEGTEILDRETNWHKHRISGMIDMNLQKKPVNHNRDTQILKAVYTPPLDDIRKMQS
ncbi:hypothetical protein QAD02_003435 [Eretmocerus hayati]|uniref:Uncharacterized protein n=1 Tax=Eretmocerus hayati TaxID=131215 RepID=A0ACC2NNJ8_9HYME|nr:hypothetical protein QAD02_003435 [Eretmocerus hayati]